MHSVLVVNPAAGGGAAARVAEPVADRLRVASEVRVVLPSSAEAATDAAAEAVASGADVLVVLGGDGLAHLAVQECAGSETALAVVPSGTGNDLGRALGMPLNPISAARVVAEELAHGQFCRWDAGRVVGGRWFATVLCAGFDARVSARVNRMRWPRGKRAYDLAVLREMANLRAMPLRVETGDEVVERDATLVAVANTRWYGGGIPVCPAADPADGLFDLTVVERVNRRDLVRMLPHLRSGRHVDHPAVRTLRAATVRLGGANGWLAHADGEPQVRLPTTIRCEPGALRVVAL